MAVVLCSNKPFGKRPNRCVALAWAFPQSFQIHHADMSPLIFDEASLLQSVGHDGNARSSYTQHLCDELLGTSPRLDRNATHTLEPRLSRWLLRCRDLTNSDDRTTEARDNRGGVPQGSPHPPLLANLYMRRFVLGWKMLGLERSLGSRLMLLLRWPVPYSTVSDPRPPQCNMSRCAHTASTICGHVCHHKPAFRSRCGQDIFQTPERSARVLSGRANRPKIKSVKVAGLGGAERVFPSKGRRYSASESSMRVTFFCVRGCCCPDGTARRARPRADAPA